MFTGVISPALLLHAGQHVYLSGPTAVRVARTFVEYLTAAAMFRAAGLRVSSPPEIANALGWDPDRPDEHNVAVIGETTTGALFDSDAVVLLDGWETSESVEVELIVAEALDIPIVRLVDAAIAPRADDPGLFDGVPA